MIRKINYGGLERTKEKVQTKPYSNFVFKNEHISGISLLDIYDKSKLNDGKSILEFIQGINKSISNKVVS